MGCNCADGKKRSILSVIDRDAFIFIDHQDEESQKCLEFYRSMNYIIPHQNTLSLKITEEGKQYLTQLRREFTINELLEKNDE